MKADEQACIRELQTAYQHCFSALESPPADDVCVMFVLCSVHPTGGDALVSLAGGKVMRYLRLFLRPGCSSAGIIAGVHNCVLAELNTTGGAGETFGRAISRVGHIMKGQTHGMWRSRQPEHAGPGQAVPEACCPESEPGRRMKASSCISYIHSNG